MPTLEPPARASNPRELLGDGLCLAQDGVFVDAHNASVVENHATSDYRRAHIHLPAGVHQRRHRVVDRGRLGMQRIEYEQVSALADFEASEVVPTERGCAT